MKIDYHPAIAVELEEIRDYYEAKSAGLGMDFVNDFENQIPAIAAMPTRWMAVRNDVRRSLMKRFPYAIFFRIAGNVVERHVDRSIRPSFRMTENLE